MDIDVDRNFVDHVACAIYTSISGKMIHSLDWETWDHALLEWERRKYRRSAEAVLFLLREMSPKEVGKWLR